MLKIQEIRELIKLMDQSNLDEFKYELDGAKITLKRNKEKIVAADVISVAAPQAPVAPAAPAKEVAPAAPKAEVAPVKEEAPAPAAPSANVDDPSLVKITSPMVGTFYASPSPDQPAYVKVGDKVDEESIVCIVEAMKLFNEIEAEVKGEIVEVLVQNEQLVEYGQPLFLVKPE
ncbi:acetyl-CoA carboxylase biotin carboxyl carrier protein [Massilibacterium senegalense]|uniref:acetyl-CoA carboxylase biotin carboxyl carrier protein n=1 Tax=Massilibacterium senegalense TaxID=1632858 RepID=UPI0007866213|nr:acetyl-CoA carboxylase biotin carboxyl carrier protein [Massilibacterium senegalense]